MWQILEGCQTCIEAINISKNLEKIILLCFRIRVTGIVEEPSEIDATLGGQTDKGDTNTSQEEQPPPVMGGPTAIQMVRVENVLHDSFKLTQEMKVSNHAENYVQVNCCRSDSVGSIHNLAGISIFWIGRFHIQPINESHVGRLKHSQSVTCLHWWKSTQSGAV